MEKVKLKNIVEFIPGINQSRIEKQVSEEKLTYYDQSSFLVDFNQDEVFVKEKILKTDLSLKKGDIVISNILQQAAIVGEANAGKILTLNFTKVDFKDPLFDKLYFLYLFNEYRGIQRQKERELQGSGAILKLTRHSLEQFIIPVTSIEEQKKIGMIYIESLQLKSKLNVYSDLIRSFADAVIDNNLRE